MRKKLREVNGRVPRANLHFSQEKTEGAEGGKKRVRHETGMTKKERETCRAFRQNIALLRMSRGMTQEDLAERLGVSRMAVAKWETGRGMPNLGNLIALRSVFCISIDDILFTTLTMEEENE